MMSLISLIFALIMEYNSRVLKESRVSNDVLNAMLAYFMYVAYIFELMID